MEHQKLILTKKPIDQTIQIKSNANKDNSKMSTSLYLKNGKRFKVTDKEELDIHESLPTATYTVGYNACSGEYYLEKIDPFEYTGKLYGNTNRNADRILRTFHDRQTASTGVLLTGEKGSGKTLLAKRISMIAATRDIVTIVVNEPWCGEKFNQFLQMIDQPAVVLFDEFEKVYHEWDKQKMMLTLLDGVYPSKKLFILTCNDKWKLDSNMRNRPGRIYYTIDYSGLDDTFIQEYCDDNLLAKHYIPKVIAVSKVFSSFNFDMLKAMVEEMNRYDESPTEVLEFLNVQPHMDADAAFKVSLFNKKGTVMNLRDSGYEEWNGNPLKQEVQLTYYQKDNYKTVRFTVDDLLKVDDATGAYIYMNKRGYKLVLKRKKIGPRFNFSALEKKTNENSSGEASPLFTKEFEKMLLENDEPHTDDESSDTEEEENGENGGNNNSHSDEEQQPEEPQSTEETASAESE